MTAGQLAVSPLAPAAFPVLPSVAGVRLATHNGKVGFRGADRGHDLFLAALPAGSTVAGVFTRTLCPSAPVDWCQRILSRGSARAVVCNSGNANAFTGAAGVQSVQNTATEVSAALGVDPDDIYLASTGVIGEPLNDAAMSAALPVLAQGLASSDSAGWESAANAIRTTDTFAKGSFAPVGATGSHVVGIAKGSGMIAPDMATMLAFIFTDAPVGAATAQQCLQQAVAKSFNRITVDSDTSTSDSVMLFATGASSSAPSDGDDVADLQVALDDVCLDLAHQIVKDGEGATKFVAVTVTGAESDSAAETIARSIADSPLVKTAIAAEDANWGRIVMAVGKAGQKADRDALAIWIGDEQVAASGARLDSYDEAKATAHLGQPEVALRADVGVGDGQATVWTCDLTHGYIDINAGYRS